MSLDKTDKNPNISYMTYGEIIKFAIDNEYGQDDTLVNVLDQLEFAEQLVVDVNIAIEDRDIIPIDVEKSYSYIGNFEYYNDRMMNYFLIGFPIGTIAFVKYFWDKPDLRASVLRKDTGADVLGMAINLWMIVSVIALALLMPQIYTYIKVRYLWFKSSTPEGMIKYQLQEAKNRGYASRSEQACTCCISS